MNKEAKSRLELILMIAKTDVEYAPMFRDMAEIERKYNEVLGTLPSDQQDVICDFVPSVRG